MRINFSKPARFGGLAAVLFAAVALAVLTSCGGSGDQAADSGTPPEPPPRVAAVDVTYYYLPG